MRRLQSGRAPEARQSKEFEATPADRNRPRGLSHESQGLPGDDAVEDLYVESRFPRHHPGLERLDPCGEGVTVQRMLAEGKHSGDEIVRAMYEALCLLCPGKHGEPHASPVSVGMKLHHLKDRIIGGKALQRIESNNHAIGVRWKIASAGTTATTGTISKPVEKSRG